MVKLWRAFWMILVLGPLLQVFARPGAAPLYQAAETPTAAPPPQAAVLAPRPGQALQGSLPIEIGLGGPGYQSIEVSFAYASNPTGIWFPLYQGNLAQGDLAQGDLTTDPTSLQNPITQWDTSAITDGNYTLRVIFTRLDRTTQIVDVPGLRVRNYTPIETDTPTPIPTTAVPPTLDTPATQTAAAAIPPTPASTAQGPKLTATAAALAAAATPTPTPTPLPPVLPLAQSNPLEMKSTEVLNSLAQGGLAVVGLFAVGGIYALARRKTRKSE